MTWEQLGAAVMFAMATGGTMWGIWFRIEGKVKEARDRADKVGDELAAHKLHIAETYVAKTGIKEWRDEILLAVAGLKDDLRHLSSRIDNMHITK